ncbi:MAG: DNA-binding response regulator [uncultured Sulfurovum sp.]|uniref:DNA-binding response regulator n=1 Tax=uncultured Sulfurovum sp. TaxID=269237 RepID=A0A6S6TK25_9BACT|nr:MAG: DNA-binding response regulator [uncultured Sulfurovum sp.]
MLYNMFMKKNIKILYVEDNDFIREEAVEYLSLIYNNVLEASNGQEALDIYAVSKPDIIISDIEMPIINGLEMVKAIRRQDKKTPIIIVTAFMNTEYLLEAVELQLVKYILKPMTNYKLDTALSLAHEYLEENADESIVQLSSNTYYDQLNRTLVIEENIIQLTHNELMLFTLLLKKSKSIVMYSEIKNEIWNYEENYRDSLRSLVRSLRHKLEGIVIKNFSGLGYRIILEK